MEPSTLRSVKNFAFISIIYIGYLDGNRLQVQISKYFQSQHHEEYESGIYSNVYSINIFSRIITFWISLQCGYFREHFKPDLIKFRLYPYLLTLSSIQPWDVYISCSRMCGIIFVSYPQSFFKMISFLHTHRNDLIEPH